MNDNFPLPPDSNTSGPTTDLISSNATPEPSRDNGEPMAECQRLREKIAQLEQERDAFRQRFETAEAEARDYHRMLTSEFRKKYTEEQLREWAMDDDETGCIPLAEFLHELEEIVRGPKND